MRNKLLILLFNYLYAKFGCPMRDIEKTYIKDGEPIFRFYHLVIIDNENEDIYCRPISGFSDLGYGKIRVEHTSRIKEDLFKAGYGVEYFIAKNLNIEHGLVSYSNAHS